MRSRLTVRLAYTAALASGVALAACYHSTHLAATWRDPNAGPLHFKKPVTVFVARSETFRRNMEDKLAARFANAVPSYRVLKVDSSADGAAVRRQLARDGFDGAIIMNVVNVNQRLVYTPGTYWYGPPYYSFANYWGTAWGYPYDPGYVSENVVVTIETHIYALNSDKLIWAARSETTNPRSVGRLSDSVIKHVMNALEKDGLLALFRSTPSARLGAH